MDSTAGIGLYLDPHRLDVRDLAVEDRSRETVLGDTVAEHAPRHGQALEDRYAMALAREIVCGGEPCRARADHGDLLIRSRLSLTVPATTSFRRGRRHTVSGS